MKTIIKTEKEKGKIKMTRYEYSITTERNEKGKPVKHTYKGERDTTEYIDEAIKRRKEGKKLSEPLTAADKMAKKLTAFSREIMDFNPHISSIEIKVEEVK